MDLREQVVEQRRHPREALLRWQVDALQRVLDELTNRGASCGGNPRMSAMTRIGMCCA